MSEEGHSKPGRRRSVLNRRPTEEGVVAELLMLLESVTSDGSITEAEAWQLDRWLKDNEASGLPGIEFLRTTLTHVLADGKVTKEGRVAIHKAVERVLPPELRRQSRERRTAVDALEKAAARAERQERTEQQRREREVNRPVASPNFMVAGVLHEGRERVVDRFARAQDPVFLVREPDNPHDKNAIEVRLSNGMQIGYVPREDAADLAKLLDVGFKHRASLTKILKGRRAPIPVVDVKVYVAESSVEGAVSQAEVPVKTATPAGSVGCGCGTLVAVLGMMAATMAILILALAR